MMLGPSRLQSDSDLTSLGVGTVGAQGSRRRALMGTRGGGDQFRIYKSPVGLVAGNLPGHSSAGGDAAVISVVCLCSQAFPCERRAGTAVRSKVRAITHAIILRAQPGRRNASVATVRSLSQLTCTSKRTGNVLDCRHSGQTAAHAAPPCSGGFSRARNEQSGDRANGPNGQVTAGRALLRAACFRSALTMRTSGRACGCAAMHSCTAASHVQGRMTRAAMEGTRVRRLRPAWL